MNKNKNKLTEVALQRLIKIIRIREQILAKEAIEIKKSEDSRENSLQEFKFLRRWIQEQDIQDMEEFNQTLDKLIDFYQVSLYEQRMDELKEEIDLLWEWEYELNSDYDYDYDEE